MIPPAMMLYSFESWARHWLDAAPASSAPRAVEVRTPATALSVVIVNWNTREILRECLMSMATYLGGVDHEVIVVDNDSSDGSADMVAADFPRGSPHPQRREHAASRRPTTRGCASPAASGCCCSTATRCSTDDSVAHLFEKVRAHGRHRGRAVPAAAVRTAACSTPPTASRRLRLALLEDFGLHKLLGRRRAARALLGGYWEHDEERDVDWVDRCVHAACRATSSSAQAASTRASSCTARTWSGASASVTPGCASASSRRPRSSIAITPAPRCATATSAWRCACSAQRDLFVRRARRAPRGAAFVAARACRARRCAPGWYAARGRLGGPRGPGPTAT